MTAVIRDTSCIPLFGPHFARSNPSPTKLPRKSQTLMQYPGWKSYAVFDDHSTAESLHSLVAFFTIDDLSQFQLFMKLLGFF